jgi:hypothetical protein
MKSNRNGRALEYALTKNIQTKYPNATLTKGTITDQKRDKEKYDSLNAKQQDYFDNNTKLYVDSELADTEVVSIERLSDDKAKKGDVTDIRLTLESGKEHNISLKHNHKAVKHQRPGALMNQLGIKNKEADKEHKAEIKKIESAFFNNIPEKLSTFEEVKSDDEKHINDLYRGVCDLSAKQINKHPEKAKEYFEFIVGSTDFQKVVITKDQVEVADYSKIEQPTKMVASISADNYVDLKFDNGFEFKMRLHTASKSFEQNKSLSLKFDTQLHDDAGAIPTKKYQVIEKK